MRSRGDGWWLAGGPLLGSALGAVDSLVNHVPVWRGEVGLARAERSGWSQVAEFASLILDAGWAWAAAAVLAGWLVSAQARPAVGLLRGAVAGALALVFATAAYYGLDVLFDGGAWWSGTTAYWLVGSVVLGPALGAVGASIRRPGPAGPLAALAVPVGAALQMVVLPPASESLMAQPVRLTVWVSAAAATVLIVRAGARGWAPARPARPDRS
ncbi:hypothetical protein [Micromonospora sp. DT233]|uniref:hypothetical protein n=1 Tax=Micromonospora sp. DT233 TaxID=3393432 RepID=UPI003CE88F4A